jgi:predicted amidohydrolase YtcJ
MKFQNFLNHSDPKCSKCLSGKIVLLLSVIILTACSQKSKVDLIVHHAVVYTVDSTFSNAQSFAVKDGKFIAVGSNEEILKNYEATEIVDAKGKAVYPGFIDSHCHFYGYGKGKQQLNLVGTKSFDEVIQKVVEYAKTNKSAWIIGRGWDQNDWEVKEYPTRKVLDSLFPNTPVFLKRVDGHAALVNAAALRKAGITKWGNIKGGSFGTYLDLKNKETAQVSFEVLNGILIDNAVDIIINALPEPTKEEIKRSLLIAQKNCFEVGLTTIDDAGLDKKIVDVIDELHQSNELQMRVYAMLSDNKINLDYYLKNGNYKTDKLNIRSFKFYADGSLGSRGACLIDYYTDKPKHRGFLLSNPEHFDSAAALMIAKGFQMNTHCIGDSAVRLISQIYLKHLESTNTNPINYRWRIEHAQVVNKNDLKMFSGIIPSVQPTHATSDMYWAKDRVGEERVKFAYAYNDLLKMCGVVALGTDFPVEEISPFYTFYAAVARKDLKDFPKGGFQPENALSRENTLRGMTIWGAYGNFEEKEKGSIEPGKFADFVILDADIMKIEINKVPTTKVVRTFVNGQTVYQQ